MRSDTTLHPSQEEFSKLPAWAGKAGGASDVVISTRARLARNLAGYPFPGRAGEQDLAAVSQLVLRAARHPEKSAPALRPIDVSALGEPDKASLIDSHLISLQLATAGFHRWVLFDNRHAASVMVNEEDHLRIQAILPGLQLDAAWRLADRIDAFFGDQLQYTADSEYGYLTASLGNCGTGLRASVMVHLPGLAWLNKLPEVLGAVRSLGTSVRGLYGEDGGAAGDVYQLSNAVSLGLNPRQIIARLAAVTTYLITEEQAITERLSRYAKGVIGTRVAEAAATLSKAEQLCGTEAMALLSILRLGERVGLPTGIDSAAFSELLVSMRIGAQYLSGNKARYTFFEETRRPALIRNKIREQQRSG